MSQIIFSNMHLETERLTIRRMEEKDAENLFAIAMKDNDAMIGVLHMMKPLEERAVSAVEIGCGIAPASLGRG